MSQPSTEVLLHELHVHQIELEMQNEELRRTQCELTSARDRYVDLYDFAPVGYFTIDMDGFIVEANLKGAAIVGMDRSDLIGQNFVSCIAAAHKAQWREHFSQALMLRNMQRVELQIQNTTGIPTDVQLDCISSRSVGALRVLWVVMIDISDRKQAEAHQRATDALIEASDQERLRASRELHEELGQRLSALKMELTSLSSAASDRPEWNARIAAMQMNIDESVSTIRKISTELSPPMLNDLGISAALDGLARNMSARLNIAINTYLEDPATPFTAHANMDLFRMVQDVLSYLRQNYHLIAVDMTSCQQGPDFVISISGTSTWLYNPNLDEQPDDTRRSLQERSKLRQGHFLADETDTVRPRFTIKIPLTSHTPPPAHTNPAGPR